MRLAPACGYNPRETSYGTGTWWVMWKTGIPVGFMGWSRVTSDRPSRVSPGESQPGSLSRTTATKKDKRSANGDNSCGIANEPSGHPNDGWLEGPEPELFGLRYVSRKFHFLARPFPRLPLGEGMPKISRDFPLPTRWRNKNLKGVSKKNSYLIRQIIRRYLMIKKNYAKHARYFTNNIKQSDN